jgi:DNA-binding XRE family transcriptional regulator
MVRLSDLRTAQALRERDAESDPALAAELARQSFPTAVAVKLIRYRSSLRLTQTQLARRLGVSQSSIARLELGESVPLLSTLEKLARETGLSFQLEVSARGTRLLPESSESGGENASEPGASAAS